MDLVIRNNKTIQAEVFLEYPIFCWFPDSKITRKPLTEKKKTGNMLIGIRPR